MHEGRASLTHGRARSWALVPRAVQDAASPAARGADGSAGAGLHGTPDGAGRVPYDKLLKHARKQAMQITRLEAELASSKGAARPAAAAWAWADMMMCASHSDAWRCADRSARGARGDGCAGPGHVALCGRRGRGWRPGCGARPRGRRAERGGGGARRRAPRTTGVARAVARMRACACVRACAQAAVAAGAEAAGLREALAGAELTRDEVVERQAARIADLRTMLARDCCG